MCLTLMPLSRVKRHSAFRSAGFDKSLVAFPFFSKNAQTILNLGVCARWGTGSDVDKLEPKLVSIIF